eukprot:1144630-Pelagomonas_calceolata.AAC.1
MASRASGAAPDYIQGGEDKVLDAESHALHSLQDLKGVTPAVKPGKHDHSHTGQQAKLCRSPRKNRAMAAGLSPNFLDPVFYASYHQLIKPMGL